MPIVYDYIVTVRRIYATTPAEEHKHPVQAYSVQDAMMTALIELEAEHGQCKDSKILSVRPDMEKVGETTRALMQDISKAARDLLKKKA